MRALAAIYALSVLAAAACTGARPPVVDLGEDPERTRGTLHALLASGRDPIAQGSSCGGIFGPNAATTIDDLLAMRFAYLDRGENAIHGSCDGAGVCTLRITHAFGEDVAAAEIRFRMKDGKVVPSSLECTLSP